MKLIKFPVALELIKNTTKKYAPEIMTGVGIAGMGGSVILAVRATPKYKLLEEEYASKSSTELTIADKTKIAIRPYAPAALTFAASAGLLIGSNVLNYKRNAALLTAYTLSETALNNYKAYKKEAEKILSEKDSKIVNEKVAKSIVDNNPPSNSIVVKAPRTGEQLCMDSYSGQYFYSDANKIDKAVNEANSMLVCNGCVSLNDYYCDCGLGLNRTQDGDDIGWHIQSGVVGVTYTSTVSSDNIPVLVVNFDIEPTLEYQQYF